ncbi:MAG: glycosyltransferase family 4 protein [Promethearchaeota archaeon]
MKILIYSYFPILKEHQAGGAQLIMRELSIGLADCGIRIRVLCPYTENYNSALLEHENIEVMPTLRERNGDELNLTDYLHNLQQASIAIEGVDVIWSIDTAFPFKVSIPIIFTSETLSYENEIEQLFRLNWDLLIIPSKFSQKILKLIFGQNYWKDKPRPIKYIPNGVNLNFFSKSNPKRLKDKLGLASSAKYLIFPHRPDPYKGFDYAFKIIEKLLEIDPRYKLLIPKGPLSKRSERDIERNYYDNIKRKASKIGESNSIIFHDWIDYRELPEYYSLAEWCLTLSVLPEGFGLTPIQSICCGTPVISTMAGGLRDKFPPEHGIRFVNLKNIDQIIYHISEKPPNSELESGRRYIEEHYNNEKIIQEYIKCFKTISKTNSLYDPNPKNKSICISPWCVFIDENVIWHEFQMREIFLSKTELRILKIIKNSKFSSQEFLIKNKKDIDNLLHEGILTYQ